MNGMIARHIGNSSRLDFAFVDAGKSEQRRPIQTGALQSPRVANDDTFIGTFIFLLHPTKFLMSYV